jgi:hypothetical protein
MRLFGPRRTKLQVGLADLVVNPRTMFCILDLQQWHGYSAAHDEDRLPSSLAPPPCPTGTGSRSRVILPVPPDVLPRH